MIPTVDAITFGVWLAIWPVWLLWELVLLVLRGSSIRVQTISMVARDKGWLFSSVVYSWCGLASHFWIPHASWNPPHPIGYALFWLVALSLGVEDAILWGSDPMAWSKSLRWRRHPALVMAAGLLLGWLLFPQRGEWP
jgi:hypothetical protein